MKTQIKFPLISFLLTGVLFVACNENPADSKERAEKANNERFDDQEMKDDASFVVHAADGNLFEIRASELAQSKATDPEVKEVASLLLRDHNQASEELKALASQKNIQLPTAISEDKQDDYQDLAEVQGSDFDEKYIDKMIDAHQEKIDEFRDHEDDTNDLDLQNWISQQIPTLEQHLDHLRQFRDNANGSGDRNMRDNNASTSNQDLTRQGQTDGVDPNSTSMQNRQLDNQSDE